MTVRQVLLTACSVYIELVWIVKRLWITVGRTHEHDYHFAFFNLLTAQVHLLARESPHYLYWTLIAKHLPDSTADEVRIVFELLQLIGFILGVNALLTSPRNRV